MSDNRWDDSLENLCKSPQEAARLKELASLLTDLPEDDCSLSFQQALRENLLSRAAEQARQRPAQQGVWAALAEKWSRVHRHTPIFIVVSAALLIFLLGTNIVNNMPPDPLGPVAIDRAGQEENPPVDRADPFLPESTGEPSTNLTEEQPPEQGGPETGPPAAPGEEEKPPGHSPAVPEQPPIGPAEQDDRPAPLPEDPDYEVYKNRQNFTLAGSVILTYGAPTGEPRPLEKVDYSWQPNKITLSTAPESNHFGSPKWAKQLLTDAGFKINEGETIVVHPQETSQGLYAEIFYQVSPPLILHVHQDRGILAYYYEEKGTVAPPGYYPLLTPTQALKQLQGLKGSAEGQQLRFTFREVQLTTHDFLLEKNGTLATIRLPAYRFTGSELTEPEEGINLYLPAVKVEG